MYFVALNIDGISSFISPAIVAPELVDVELPKDEEGMVIRRGLMVIAKIIQNLANNIFFGKEPYMIGLNTFLQDNIVNVTRYLSEVNVCHSQLYMRFLRLIPLLEILCSGR
jgi:hypothetical protein